MQCTHISLTRKKSDSWKLITNIVNNLFTRGGGREIFQAHSNKTYFGITSHKSATSVSTFVLHIKKMSLLTAYL